MRQADIVRKEKVILKSGKEFPIKNRHHWIFSGAVESAPKNCDGSLFQVLSSQQELLGWGYFNEKCSIFGRMVNFNDEDPFKSMEESFLNARNLRMELFPNKKSAFRLINGEGDRLPGLIIDIYDEIAIIQVSTLGMDKLKPFILELLIKHLKPKTILEKSLSASRRLEGLNDKEGLVFGEDISTLAFEEDGVAYNLNLKSSQKTGFFLDQRETRKTLQRLAKGRRVLDCCSYIGAFSLACLKGGAQSSTLVDTSQSALDIAGQNLNSNGFEGKYSLKCADIFDFLEGEELKYDLVILDPPAFAKKREDIKRAFEAYRKLNSLAFQKLPPKSLVLTCSCSYHMGEELFQKAVFQALLIAKRNGKMISKHRLAFDHPLSFFHPEMDYLKSFLIWLD